MAGSSTAKILRS
jgi:hypothetical protein